jgi:hypothetical protein
MLPQYSRSTQGTTRLLPDGKHVRCQERLLLPLFTPRIDGLHNPGALFGADLLATHRALYRCPRGPRSARQFSLAQIQLGEHLGQARLIGGDGRPPFFLYYASGRRQEQGHWEAESDL